MIGTLPRQESKPRR